MTTLILEHFFRALLVGGFICLIGQLLFDVADLTPAHTMSVLVCLGALSSLFGWYPALVEFAGFGASLPIASFGNSLLQGSLESAALSGWWGVLSGMLEPVSSGVAAAVAFGFIVALVFKPKS